jgi:heme-degrading monooxygenase HmoA
MEALMTFVQIIDFETERLEEMEQLLREARQRNAGGSGGPIRHTLLRDRDNPRRYLSLIEFESYEEAMRNSDAPETTEMARRLGELCVGERVYTNCDLLRADELQ